MFNLKELIKNKEAIFIDIDNTLFNYNIAHRVALGEVLKKFNFDISIYNRAKINIKKRDLKSNHHKKELYFKNMCELQDRHFSDALKMYDYYHCVFSENLLADKSMMKLLEYSKNSGIKIVAITNYYVIPQIKKLLCSNFSKYIDYLITSEEFEVEKPNVKLLNRAIELSGCTEKDKIIMFGDSVVDDLSCYDIDSYPYNCSKLLISISGKSGAGKSTITKLLKDIFNSEVIEGDGYHKYERTHSAWNNVTHYNPEANNLVQLGLDIKNIYQEINSIQVPIYNHETGKFENHERLDTDLDTLIIDGLHSLYPEVTGDYVKIKIFIDNSFADTQKIERDVNHRNKTEEEVQSSINKREQDYYKYIDNQKDYSNFVISIFEHGCTIRISDFINIDYSKISASKVQDKLGIFLSIEKDDLFKVLKEIFVNIKEQRWI